jgi:hypothetical protein
LALPSAVAARPPYVPPPLPPGGSLAFDPPPAALSSGAAGLGEGALHWLGCTAGGSATPTGQPARWRSPGVAAALGAAPAVALRAFGYEVAAGCWGGGGGGGGGTAAAAAAGAATVARPPLLELLEREAGSAARGCADFKLQSIEEGEGGGGGGGNGGAAATAAVVLSLAPPYTLRPRAYSLRSGSFFEPQMADWALEASADACARAEDVGEGSWVVLRRHEGDATLRRCREAASMDAFLVGDTRALVGTWALEGQGATAYRHFRCAQLLGELRAALACSLLLLGRAIPPVRARLAG